MPPYSPERRTALILCGTGAHGAYHAGVLRALQEAGVKIDLVAGQGVGAGGAALAAIDGGSRLWDANGIWTSEQARRLYSWTSAPIAAAAAVGGLLLVLVVNAFAAGLGRGLSWPWLLLVVALTGGIIAGAAFGSARGGRLRRRAAGPWWWRLVGAPVDGARARAHFIQAIWELIRGAAPIAAPSRAAQGRRYSEVLAENLGQPGFRELLLIATDLDARRDVIAALLREPFRADFLRAAGERGDGSDVLDLAGVGREYALDIVAAALTPPVICEPEPVTFARDSYWRGETHRFCDRPGAINRLLGEVASAGVTQAIVVSAVAATDAPHKLRVPRRDWRSRLGEFDLAAQSAALREALEIGRLLFDGIFVIAPTHNAVGPFDVAGAYDAASDRRQEIGELMERAYEDAYRQFIEPVVGASGDHLAQPAAPAAALAGAVTSADDAILHNDDGDPSRLRDLD